MAFRMTSVALAASLALLCGIPSVHAQTTSAPAKMAMKKMMKKPMHHMAKMKGHGPSASAQDPAVDKLNAQSLAAAQSGTPMTK